MVVNFFLVGENNEGAMVKIEAPIVLLKAPEINHHFTFRKLLTLHPCCYSAGK